jgi:Ca2+-transporting ATPase
MATAHADGAGAVLHVKGALDALLAHCRSWQAPGGPRPLDALARQAFQREAAARAARALRVLAVASRPVPRAELLARGPAALLEELTLVGLVGLLDPVRPEAKEAIARCHRAGIAVRMITGDHPGTAAAVAFELGIAGEALTGRALDGLDDAALAERAPRTGVFARVSPEHKLRIVRALRAAGRVVAMTGDGVNDAPALREAHIGVAMGRGGTEVAKEAAALVLTDDHFATIVEAVREGRTIYDNLVKFLRFQLSTNLGALLTVLLAPLLALPSPFLPAQILWVNLIVDGPPAMALGVDPARPGLMEDPPRDPGAQILTLRRLLELAFSGLVMAGGTLGVLWWALPQGSEPQARTLAFTTFVLFQVANSLCARAEGRSIFSRHLFSNGKLWLALLAVVGIQVLSVEWPPMERLLGTTDLSLRDWLVSGAVASTVLWAEELRKLLARLRRRAARAA